ncbi:MAG TPA: substrate binding domain-containing protein, partial [Burkholderiales bacterium]|nr:substrate binding domain-containing protein [Burkholderiales bacterium]
SIRRVVCASPSYLKMHGTPRSTDELSGHLLLAYRRPRNGRVREWRFCVGSTIQNMAVNGYMTFNSGEALVAAATAGLGIIQVAEYYVKDELKNGTLVEILPAFSFEGHIIYAVFSQQQSVPRKARVFVDFLVSLFNRPPWTNRASITAGAGPNMLRV